MKLAAVSNLTEYVSPISLLDLVLFCFIFFITDKDECATDQHDCAEGMVCQNMIGGYDCVCPTGFKATNEVPPCEGQYNVETLK